ncbi:hypothetical protein DFH09DRAFT_1074649 [Mycena vulgaris]|nr:hypothetical protein DFH09DRAFT_1074649 [Mycena vulgaris]
MPMISPLAAHEGHCRLHVPSGASTMPEQTPTTSSGAYPSAPKAEAAPPSTSHAPALVTHRAQQDNSRQSACFPCARVPGAVPASTSRRAASPRASATSTHPSTLLLGGQHPDPESEQAHATSSGACAPSCTEEPFVTVTAARTDCPHQRHGGPYEKSASAAQLQCARHCVGATQAGSTCHVHTVPRPAHTRRSVTTHCTTRAELARTTSAAPLSASRSTSGLPGNTHPTRTDARTDRYVIGQHISPPAPLP